MKNSFREAVEKAEDSGASMEELRTLLGRGRAKKGIFEGDLEEGELEIGQVSSIISRQQPVAEVMKELVEACQRAAKKIICSLMRLCRHLKCTPKVRHNLMFRTECRLR